MKKYSILVGILVVFFVGLAGCKSDEKSKECEIVSFTVGGVAWTISGNDLITPPTAYPKGANVSNLVPTIVYKGASINPPSGAARDFSENVTYTVTAEDGKTTKSYTARAIVATE